ncbi:MAG: DUF4838 domain-containing protein [Pirellulales bacterium]
MRNSVLFVNTAVRRVLLAGAAALLVVPLATPRVAQAAPPVQLAAEGKALESVVVSAGASEGVKALAAQLADYLGRVSGAKFEVQTDNGERGIVVGRAEDFPAIKTGVPFDPSDATRREEYLLRSHDKGLWLLGATEMGARHAVWDLLYRLGYRQFFPGKTWEVVPHEKSLGIAVDAFERPSYHARRIWYGFGPWDYAAEPYEDWCMKNRATSGTALSTGHSYDGVVNAARKEFDAHPEYWPLLRGERKPVSNPKPCLGNPAVRTIFVRHALAQFEKNPSLDSISMDPSDGGGWCECEKCAQLGTVSDRVVTVANEVATAINAKFPGKLVGIYAYNYHSPPPNVRVSPKVVVSVATAFIKGDQSLDEIIAGWSAKGATLGIREYYSVNTWDRDQPGHARGGNLDYLRRTIPEFHAKGARFMSAESSDNWGPNGLGYYLASRMLWDVQEAGRIDALVEDFLVRAFGPAKEPMREFYGELDGSKPHLVVDDQLGRMHCALEKARGLAGDPTIRARVDELALYAHYCSLYHQYDQSEGPKRQAAFEALVRHAYRMRTTMLIHAKALYRDLATRDESVKLPAGAEFSVPEKSNPWKSSAPFTEAEIVGFLKDGIARHPLATLAFQPVQFSANLVPASAALQFPKTYPAGDLGPGRNVQTFYTYVEKAPATIEMRVTGGLIAHYRDRGHVKIDVWKIGGPSQTGQQETPVASDRSVPPDGVERTVKLAVNEPGLLKLTVSDGNDRTQVKWPADQSMTVLSSQDVPMNEHYSMWMQYFYVPKGTKNIGLFGGGHGEIRDSENRPHFWLNGREPNYYNVPVPPGQDGKIWFVRYGKGSIRLLTVPPCFATTPQELLLPKEVVDKDARKP